MTERHTGTSSQDDHLSLGKRTEKAYGKESNRRWSLSSLSATSGSFFSVFLLLFPSLSLTWVSSLSSFPSHTLEDKNSVRGGRRLRNSWAERAWSRLVFSLVLRFLHFIRAQERQENDSRKDEWWVVLWRRYALHFLEILWSFYLSTTRLFIFLFLLFSLEKKRVEE